MVNIGRNYGKKLLLKSETELMKEQLIINIYILRVFNKTTTFDGR